LNTNTKYVDAVFGGAEALMPTMLSHFGRKFIEQNVGHGTDPTTWPTLTNSFIKSYNMLTEMPVIANLRVGTEYVVLVRVDVAVMKTGTLNSSAIISLNGARAGVVRTGWNAAYTAFNSVVMPVRVKKSDHQLTIKIESVGTVNYYYGIQVDAIFY
jgi:hypothetical protein